MCKAYIGLDVHKEIIVIGIAEAGGNPPFIYGKCSSDIRRFLKVFRTLLKKHEWGKGDGKLCYEAGV